MIDVGFLAEGEALEWVPENAGTAHVATVGVDGTLKLEDGTVHATPSAAAKHLVGYEVNGWRVWQVRRTRGKLSEEWDRMGHGGSAHLDGGVTTPNTTEDVRAGLSDSEFIEALPPSLLVAGRSCCGKCA